MQPGRTMNSMEVYVLSVCAGRLVVQVWCQYSFPAPGSRLLSAVARPSALPAPGHVQPSWWWMVAAIALLAACSVVVSLMQHLRCLATLCWHGSARPCGPSHWLYNVQHSTLTIVDCLCDAVGYCTCLCTTMLHQQAKSAKPAVPTDSPALACITS